MKGLCNFADERSGGLLTVKDIIQIDRINTKKFKCKPIKREPSFSTGFFYNMVNTHGEYYTQLCTKVKWYGGRGCVSRRLP